MQTNVAQIIRKMDYFWQPATLHFVAFAAPLPVPVPERNSL
jgi:hypothetical protein